MTAPRTILALNAGSSSLKFALFEARTDGALAAGPRGEVESLGSAPRLLVRSERGEVLADQACGEARDHRRALAAVAAWWRERSAAAPIAGIGHRVVHGGSTFDGPVLLDAPALAAIERLTPLAPLHQPQSVAVIRAASTAFPGVSQVACFDTAFHRTQPALAQVFALPRRFDDEGVRRYGFHGLSYEYVASVLPDLDPQLAEGRVVVAHLGNGASACALRASRSIATTMGFSTLDGLVMGTRPGALDPGVLLYLMQRYRMGVRALERLLYRESGLRGVSELSSDMRTLLASADPRAREAVDLFVYRLGREIGSLAAALGGLDALVFTGGIGERSAPIRARACRDAAWLGVVLDEQANAAASGRISAPGARVSAWVVRSDENLAIARHTARMLADVPS